MFSACNLDSMMSLLLKYPFYIPAAIKCNYFILMWLHKLEEYSYSNIQFFFSHVDLVLRPWLLNYVSTYCSM